MKQDHQQESDSDVIDIDLAREMGRVCVCFNLRKATRYVTQFYDKELRSTGLRVTQLTLLTAIRVMAPTNLKRLSEAVGMDQTTLSRNIGLLQKKGLVELEAGSDLRYTENFPYAWRTRRIKASVSFVESGAGRDSLQNWFRQLDVGIGIRWFDQA